MTPASEATGAHGSLHVFRRLAEEDPNRLFLSIDGVDCTRAEFMASVSVCAGALARRGIGPGDYIALAMPNSLSWCFFFWAAVSLGARPIPLDPQIGAFELGNLSALIDIRLYVIVPRFRSADLASSLLAIAAATSAPPTIVCVSGDVPGTVPLAAFLDGATPGPLPSRMIERDETLMVACTSGTTGNPKVIVVPHQGFLSAQRDMADHLKLCPEDRMLLGMPLYHQGGFGMGLQALVSGASAVYCSVFDPIVFLKTIQARKITALQLSPTLAKILLSTPDLDRYDLSSLRLCYFAGELLPDDLAAEFWQKRGIRVVNIIGSSETATMVIWDSRDDRGRSPSEFRPLSFTRARVANYDGSDAVLGAVGSLWVATDAVLKFYLGNEAETSSRIHLQDGVRWFDTQDLVTALPEGRVRFVGRAKRVIKRGANLIHPEEVEAFLLSHPSIAAVALVKEDHELFGESVVA